MSDPRPVYSEVMEDPEVVASALQIRDGETAVVIASAGDNVFDVALRGAGRVYGVDVLGVQVELCRLKEAAARAFGWRELAELVGALDSAPDRRAELLDRLPEARPFEDDRVRGPILHHGLASCGQLAAFVAPLAAGLNELVGVDAMAALLGGADRSERRATWSDHFVSPAVAHFLHVALNEDTISDAFIPAWAFDRMAEPAFGRFYHGVLRHLTVELDPRTNWFLHRLWTGRFPGAEALPPYLLEASFDRLRGALGRVSWHTADVVDLLRSLPDGHVHAVNLSNVLDWCDDDAAAAIWAELDRVVALDGRLFLRSFLAERALPDDVAARWSTSPERNAAFARADRVGYFSRYELWTRSAS